MSDEKIIEQAIKAGISREIAKESLNGQYDEWIEKVMITQYYEAT